MDIKQVMQERHSVRQYTDTPIPKDTRNYDDFDPDMVSMGVLIDTLRLGVQITRELPDRSKQPASEPASASEGGIR